MNRRAKTQLLAVLSVGTAALAGPPIVDAQSRGGGPSGGASPTGQGQPGESAPITSGTGTVTASGNGITFATRAAALLRRPLRFSGNAGRRAAGHVVEIERRGRETGWTWQPTAHGIAASDGSFSAVWPANHIGRFAIRAVVERRRAATAASTSSALTITVYRPSVATIYGPGFYGRRTACGQTLRTGTIGVANRTLKCGTAVAIYYGGRTLVVHVIDRGPYGTGADWDLTEATARALRLNGTATIGAVSLRSR